MSLDRQFMALFLQTQVLALLIMSLPQVINLTLQVRPLVLQVMHLPLPVLLVDLLVPLNWTLSLESHLQLDHHLISNMVQKVLSATFVLGTQILFIAAPLRVGQLYKQVDNHPSNFGKRHFSGNNRSLMLSPLGNSPQSIQHLFTKPDSHHRGLCKILYKLSQTGTDYPKCMRCCTQDTFEVSHSSNQEALNSCLIYFFALQCRKTD